MWLRLMSALLLLVVSITSHAQSMAYKACTEKVAVDPKLAPLKNKISLGDAGDQTFQMKTNSNKTTSSERKLVVRWVDMLEECWKSDAEYRSGIEAHFRVVLESTKRDFDQQALSLHDGKITYGEFARKRGEIDSNHKAKWEEADNRIKQSQEQLRQQELQANIERQRQQQQQQQQQQERQQQLQREQQQQQAAQEQQRRQAQQMQQAYEAQARIAECENARRNMNSFCGQAERDPGRNFTANFECGRWRSITSDICR